MQIICSEHKEYLIVKYSQFELPPRRGASYHQFLRNDFHNLLAGVPQEVRVRMGIQHDGE